MTRRVAGAAGAVALVATLFLAGGLGPYLGLTVAVSTAAVAFVPRDVADATRRALLGVVQIVSLPLYWALGSVLGRGEPEAWQEAIARVYSFLPALVGVALLVAAAVTRVAVRRGRAPRTDRSAPPVEDSDEAW